MTASYIELNISRSFDLPPEAVSHKRAILQHFLGYNLPVRIAQGPYARAVQYWYVPMEGCARLVDHDQPLADEILTRYPACTVQAILGPTGHGRAVCCIDCDDSDGVDWHARTLGRRGPTVAERTPHGAHYYYEYQLDDAPNGEELPKCERLFLGDGVSGSVDLRTHNTCTTLTGSISPKDGSIYGPWIYQWGFRQLARDELAWLAELAQHSQQQAARQKEAVMQPAPVVAPTTPAPVVQPVAAPIVQPVQPAPIVLHRPPALMDDIGAPLDRRLDAYAQSVEDALCAELAACAEGTRNSTLNNAAFQLARAYRERGDSALPQDTVDRLLGAATACGLPAHEALTCIQHAQQDVFQRGKGAAFKLVNRPARRRPHFLW